MILALYLSRVRSSEMLGRTCTLVSTSCATADARPACKSGLTAKPPQAREACSKDHAENSKVLMRFAALLPETVAQGELEDGEEPGNGCDHAKYYSNLHF